VWSQVQILSSRQAQKQLALQVAFFMTKRFESCAFENLFVIKKANHASDLAFVFPAKR
jgi:hypothetical protein